MGAKDRFLTRQKANAGVQMPLLDPTTGQETDQWILIIGRDSDAARRYELEEQRELRRRYADVNSKDKRAMAEIGDAIDEELPERTRKQIASFVADWSWKDEDPCTQENVIAFLKDAPQIADAIDTFVSNRVLFFGRAAKTSSPSPRPTSDSTDGDQDQKEPSEKT